MRLFVAGGSVRDAFLQKDAGDLDLFVAGSSRRFARCVLAELQAGSFIDLSVPEEETARIVWQGQQIDISSPRLGAASVEDDLRLRDFTINAMALELIGESAAAGSLLDPTAGLVDLQAGVVRHLPGAFTNDPLRMLRGYRFVAGLGFRLAHETEAQIRQDSALIKRVAAERIDYELQHIFRTGQTAGVLLQMIEAGLLQHILPELFWGQGVAQPEFHHLDVMDHELCALQNMELILAEPETYYPESPGLFTDYLAEESVKRALKWAALLHDIGKPETKETRPEDGRVTFYRHDEQGVVIFQKIAERLRWSKAFRGRIANLIGAHMHPFHLCNVQRAGTVSKKAALKLHHRIGGDMPGLFLLAMSDSLASEGEKKPPEMERELQMLLVRIHDVYENDIKPVVTGPRLLSGHDIMVAFGLTSGPRVGRILEALEACRVEEGLADRAEALAWVGAYIQRENE